MGIKGSEQANDSSLFIGYFAAASLNYCCIIHSHQTHTHEQETLLVYYKAAFKLIFDFGSMLFSLFAHPHSPTFIFEVWTALLLIVAAAIDNKNHLKRHKLFCTLRTASNCWGSFMVPKGYLFALPKLENGFMKS